MHKHWHAMTLDQVASAVKSGPAGLESAEVDRRTKEYGKNTLPQEQGYSKLRLFLSQFHSPLMYILLVTVGISFFLRHFSDGIFIVAILLLNTSVGYWQENKANESLAALKQMVKIRSRVFRGGFELEIDSEDLVPGDLILLKAGDKVPADVRIVEAKGLRINEASLTGESLAVDKSAAAVLTEETALPDRKNMAFMGTIAEDGWSKALVVATGKQTQIGEVISLLKETEDQKTPLQKKILSLSKLAGAFILSIVGIIALIGYFTEQSFADVFVASLALAVSAIPEGLLPAITVILVLGMRRILKDKGLVRRLATTETLGSVTVICTDKTGTLTEGKMQVSHILTTTKELLGNQLDGVAQGQLVNGIESHITALKIAVLSSEAFIENPEATLKQWVVRGRATDRALLLAGTQAGLDKRQLEEQYPLLDRIPFSSENKFSAVLRKKTAGKHVLHVVGAPEIVIAKSVQVDSDGKARKLSERQSQKLLERLDQLAKQGLRVVACAYRDYAKGEATGALEPMVQNLRLVGFIALKDPLRRDAKSSIATTKKAGIRTIIVTGDHRYTARAIAEEIGITASDSQILEGKDLETMDQEVLRERVKDAAIFARVSPRHKLQIVDALQANGEVVAMMGDGVNDAPALKLADIGVAVGSGTDVAKETADLVLLDDNFKTILKAIEQGRIIFGNIRKVLVYLVADDFSEIFLFLTSMALGLPLPLLPAQILWINLVEDGLPAITLTTEQETKGVMEQKPRDPKEPLFHRPLQIWMAAIFAITGLAAFLSFITVLWVTGDVERTRTIVFTLMCVDSLVFALCVRSFRQSAFRKDILSNRYLAGGIGISFLLLLGAIYLPPLQFLLGTVPLGLLGWSVVVSISAVELVLIEYAKKRAFSAENLQRAA